MMQVNDYRRLRLVLRLERLDWLDRLDRLDWLDRRRPPTVEADRVNDERDSKPVTPPPFVIALNDCIADCMLLMGAAGAGGSSPPCWRWFCCMGSDGPPP